MAVAPPTIKQQVKGGSGTQTALTSTATLAAATAGNLLVFTLAGDKNTGTMTVKDNISTTGTGWTVSTSLPQASVSLYIAWKVAVGGETTITGTTSAAPTTGNTCWASELQQTGTQAWALLSESERISDNTAQFSWASNVTAPAAPYAGLGIAVGVIDSMSSWGDPTYQNVTWSNGFVSQSVPVYTQVTGSGGGSAGCYVATKDVLYNTTTSTTFALPNSATDQMSVAIAVFGRQIPDVAVPVVNAGADATITVNTTFARTATESNSPTSRAWTIQSGPAGVGTTIGTAAALSWTPTVAGTYTLRFTATNAGGTSAPDDVIVTVLAAPTAPVISAGADVASHPVSTVFNRTATESDGGSAITSRAWTIQSGPAGAGTTIGTSTALSWTPTVAGTYVLRYTAVNGIGTSQDEATVTVVLPAAPTANAGADVASHTVSTTFTRTAAETGTGITAREWKVISGPVGAGDIISTAALLSWTPQTTGTYVLQYYVANAGGNASDQMTITVNPAPVSGKPNTFVMQHAEKIVAAATTNSAPLPNAPAAGALVISVLSGNKQLTTITPPSGFTKRAQYAAASVSGALADGSANPGAWNYAGGNLTDNSAVGSFETNITGWSFSSAAQFPNPVNEGDVFNVSGDLGATPVDGTVFCLVGVDSAYVDDDSAAWTSGSVITFSNGYTEIGRKIQQNSTGAGDGPNAQGVAFILAKKDVAVGDSTQCTFSWSGGNPPSIADQCYMILSEYAVSETDGVPPEPPTGEAGTLTSAWRGIDAINLRLAGGSGNVRVDFSTSSDMSNPISSALVAPDSQGNAHVLFPSSLIPDSTYYYRAFRGGQYIGTAQQIKTLPAPDVQSSFSFGFASCRNSDVDSPIITNAITRGADMFLEIGDLFYDNVSTNEPAKIRDGYDDALGKTNISTVFKTLATAYVWDDHDFGGDGSNGTSASKPAANLVYRERVPHVDLPSSSGVYHTFKVGRARFIMLDCRAFRSPVAQTPDDANKTMLGTAQKAWLKDLLANPDTALTFIVSSVGWHSSLSTRMDDDWGFYLTEQAEIAAAITASNTECVFLCGDMHKLAIATPAQNTPAAVHVWQAAPLNCYDNNVKGGPYREAPLYGQSQYGFVDVTDNATSMTVTFSAIKSDGTVWNTDSVTVQLAPQVDAGADASVTQYSTFTRTGTETGSGITSRSWQIQSGPAGVGSTISNAAALSWTPTVAGTYVLAYSATSPGGTGTDTVTITVPALPVPIVDAGADATVQNRSAFARTGSEISQNVSGRAWTIESGPAGVGTTLTTSAVLNWTPTVPGSYVLRYSVTNAAGTGWDELTLTATARVFGVAGSATSSSTLSKVIRRAAKQSVTVTAASAVTITRRLSVVASYRGRTLNATSALTKKLTRTTPHVDNLLTAESLVDGSLIGYYLISSTVVATSALLDSPNVLRLRLIEGTATVVSDVPRAFMREPYTWMGRGEASAIGDLLQIRTVRSVATVTADAGLFLYRATRVSHKTQANSSTQQKLAVVVNHAALLPVLLGQSSDTKRKLIVVTPFGEIVAAAADVPELPFAERIRLINGLADASSDASVGTPTFITGLGETLVVTTEAESPLRRTILAEDRIITVGSSARLVRWDDRLPRIRLLPRAEIQAQSLILPAEVNRTVVFHTSLTVNTDITPPNLVVVTGFYDYQLDALTEILFGSARTYITTATGKGDLRDRYASSVGVVQGYITAQVDATGDLVNLGRLEIAYVHPTVDGRLVALKVYSEEVHAQSTLRVKLHKIGYMSSILAILDASGNVIRGTIPVEAPEEDTTNEPIVFARTFGVLP